MLDRLTDQLADRTRAAVAGALSRANRTRRPRHADIDWDRTIHANLRTWLPEQRTLVPERLVGYGRHRPSLARDVVIALDQSGSMTDSIVHASLFACVLARLPALRTTLVAFDTSAADLSHLLDDPVDVLFGVQLGGGTDIANALAVCQRLITRPQDTVLLLISDLFEGGDAGLMRARVAALVRSGVTVVVLLALSDEGAPVSDQHHAAELGGARRVRHRVHAGRVPRPARVGPGPPRRAGPDSLTAYGPFGSPSTRSPMMLRITSSVPPATRMPGVPTTS